MSTSITVIGTIATDPHMVGAGSSAPFCTFRLANNERRYDGGKGEWVDGHTNWFSVQAFRGLGEHAEASLRKGDRVIVHGRMRVRDWESKEKRGTTAEIDAEALGHDLRFGVSRFEKRSKPVDQGSEQQDGQPGDRLGDGPNDQDGSPGNEPPLAPF